MWGYIVIAVVLNFVYISYSFTLEKPIQTEHYCPAKASNQGEFGIFEFPETPATEEGVKTRVACPFGFKDHGWQPLVEKIEIANTKTYDQREAQSGATRVCRLRSNNGIKLAQWEPEENITVKDCRNIGSMGAERTIRDLVLDVPITPWNFKQAIPMMEPLSYHAQNDYKAAEVLINSISKMLSLEELFEDEMGAADAVLLFSYVEGYATSAHLEPGYKMTVGSSFITVQTARFPYNDSSSIPKVVNYSSSVDNVKFQFPSEIIQKSLEQDVEYPRLKMTAYSEDLMFHWNWKQNKSSSAKLGLGRSQNQNDSMQMLGNWRVFSIEVIDTDITDLSHEFEYTFYPEGTVHVEGYKWKCVFWNESENEWSSDGMQSIETEDSIICKSNHFTAFSLLIDPLPLPFPGSDYAPIQNSVHSNILSILSSIGSAVSIVGLAGVILTYGLFRSLRKERSNRILLNLCISLLFMHLMSISSTKDLWNGYCLIPSMLLQYFLHTSLFWMLMEAHHMHQLLISVFVKPESRFLMKRCLIAWGIPLIIVGICTAIRPDVYETGRYDTCIIAAHLSLPLYYIAYMTPVIIILLVNFGIFCRIFNVLYKQTVRQKKQIGKTNVPTGNRIPDKGDLNQKIAETLKAKTKYVMLSPTQIKGAVTVMILVGAGWVIGLFAIGPFEVFFKYLFAIFNAGQGVLIFIFRVILHPQACREWRKAVLGLNIDSTDLSTTSSTSVNIRKVNKPSFSISPTFISASNSVENSLTASNPQAKDLAQTLASMLRNSDAPATILGTPNL